MQCNINLDTARRFSVNVDNDVIRIQNCLRRMIPSDAWKNGSVGVAGSCALYWYMLCLPNLTNPLNWIPNDIDIFVCGNFGKSEKIFEHL